MKRRVSVADVIRIAASVSGVTVDDIRLWSRRAPIRHIRTAAMIVARRHVRWADGRPASLQRIATAFNRLDHTTVLHALKRCDDPDIFPHLDAIEAAVIQHKEA